jgi:hypothetical protein
MDVNLKAEQWIRDLWRHHRLFCIVGGILLLAIAIASANGIHDDSHVEVKANRSNEKKAHLLTCQAVGDAIEEHFKKFNYEVEATAALEPSVITSKPANYDHVKTGQRTRSGATLFYLA